MNRNDILNLSRHKMLKYKDVHKGKRCVIIGNGPSLNKMDLSFLKNEITFGMNKIYLGFDKFDFRPTYYVSVNPLVLEQSASEIKKLNCPRFLSQKGIEYFNTADYLNENIMFLNTQSDWKFRADPLNGLWEGYTVTFVAMQLAYYMGFSEVVLIGVDHNFKATGKPNEEVVAKEDDASHFDPTYFGKGLAWNLPDLDNSEKAYMMAKEAYEANGRKIIDATFGGKLQVFEKADYKELFFGSNAIQTDTSNINLVQNGHSDNNYLVSAIVSTYNSEKYIRYCLDDLLRQTIYKTGQLEIVIVNANSEQNEDSIIKNEYLDKYPHIKYIKTEKRETLYKAWNIAIKAASGKYITNANTDDGHKMDAFEIMSRELDNSPDVDLVYGHSKKTDRENQIFEECTSYEPFYNIDYSPLDTLLHFQFGPQPMWRKLLHDKIGYFGDDFFAVGDYDFNMRFALSGCKAKLIPQLLGIYYNSPFSITNSFSKQGEEKIALLQKYRTYDNIIKLYKLAGWATETKEEQAKIFDNQAFKSVAYHAAGIGRKLKDPIYAAFCSKIAIKLKDDKLLKLALIVDTNNYGFMKDIIPVFQKEFNVMMVDVYNPDDVGYAYKWADVIWLEWLGQMAAKISTLPKRCRVVMRVHAFEVFLDTVYKADYKNIDGTIFLAKNIKDYFLSKVEGRLPLPNDMLQISGGVDLKRFKFKERKHGFNVAFIGVLSLTKNISLLLQILKMLVRKDSRYHLHAFGELGIDSVSAEVPGSYITHMIKEMGLQNNITIHGYVENEKFSQVMGNMNYIISTSYREGLTYNIAEAMAMGIKPIIHNWPGAKSNYPEKYIFTYIDEVLDIIDSDYNSREYRDYVENYHDLDVSLKYMVNVVKGEANFEYGYGATENFAALNKKAKVLAESGKINKAIEILNEVVAQDNDYFDSNFNLGVLYNMKGQTEKAIEHYLVCLKTRPNDRNTVINLVYAYRLLGKIDDAKNILSQFLKENKEDFEMKNLFDTL